MSSRLNTGDHSRYKAADDEEEQGYYEEEEWTMSQTTKHVLIGAGVVVSGALLYLFCVVLPRMFIPELTTLFGISKVQDLAVNLVPVSPEVTSQWGIETWDNFDSTEDDEDNVSDSETEELVNETGSASAKKLKERIILIGDIHGQYTQMRKLLRKIRYDKHKDHILVLGDFIAKGPDSFKVLDFLINNNVDCILGNHEYYALQNYAQFHGLDSPFFVTGEKKVKSLDLAASGFNEDPEYLLAKKLQPHHVNYINLCGLIKKLGTVPLHSSKNDGKRGHAQGLAVHAGLRWDLTSDLNEQDPNDCLEMRLYLEPFYNETTSDPRESRAVSWSKIWNGKIKNGTVAHKYVVYYGHDAHRGLNLKKWAKGIDNGCVRGDYLAAMVLWQEETKKGSVLYKEQPVRVKC